jgi:transposase-like protein
VDGGVLDDLQLQERRQFLRTGQGYQGHSEVGMVHAPSHPRSDEVRLHHEDGRRRQGPVEVDETFVGGNPKNMHAKRRLAIMRKRSEVADWKATHRFSDKVPVMGMLDRESRQVRARVVPNVKRETLQNEILKQIERGSEVYTDNATAYYDLAAQQYIHETVNHVNEYVRGEVTRTESRISGAC